MSEFNPEKLSVKFKNGVTYTEPIIPRKYTLTHSDITAELFLTIGPSYAYNEINSSRDEVLGEWIKKGEAYAFYVYLHVDDPSKPLLTPIRNSIFRRELPLALKAIRYGDRKFFDAHPKMDYYPIIVNFISSNKRFNKIENWGTFSEYNTTNEKRQLESISHFRKTYLLDVKFGDVNGDGIIDKVSLYGDKQTDNEIYTDNITIVIEDGYTHKAQNIIPEFNAGYNAGLFLGDFTKDNTDDIKLSIDSGGSGGYGYFYIYSFKNNNLKEIFNFDKYNSEYKYIVDYSNLYKVNVGNVTLDKLFIIDISYKGYDYLSKYYFENGILKNPVKGEVLALSTLVPIINDNSNFYNLLSFQRIIGTSNSDNLGFVQNLLSFNGKNFTSSMLSGLIPGTNLISPI